MRHGLVVLDAGAGTVAAVAIAPALARTTLAVTTGPVIDGTVLVRAALYSLVVLAVALAVPLIAISRRGVGDLVQRDD